MKIPMNTQQQLFEWHQLNCPNIILNQRGRISWVIPIIRPKVTSCHNDYWTQIAVFNGHKAYKEIKWSYSYKTPCKHDNGLYTATQLTLLGIKNFGVFIDSLCLPLLSEVTDCRRYGSHFCGQFHRWEFVNRWAIGYSVWSSDKRMHEFNRW